MSSQVSIMIVDDEPICRLPLCKILEHDGFKAVGLANGRAALASLASVEPDVIVLDLCMPEIDGTEFLRALRKHPFGGKIPVIVLSGVADQEKIRIVGALGVREYLIKAKFTPEDLVQRINRCVAESKKPAAPPATKSKTVA